MQDTHVKTGSPELPCGRDGRFLLLVGRWHGVTADQESSLRAAIKGRPETKIVFVITASDVGGTRRHPLFLAERTAIVESLGKSIGLPYEVHAAPDTEDSSLWTDHIRELVKKESQGATDLDPLSTTVLSANPDVVGRYQKAGYSVVSPSSGGAMPMDFLAAVARGADWLSMASEGTKEVFGNPAVVSRVVALFGEVLLNEDGELSHGRDFEVYSRGMDASLAVKIQDICPHVLPGKIVDKGCGTGTLLVHLGELFPHSAIVGMDLSRELLHVSESQHYRHGNVAVVKGNIIHQRFAAGTLSTIIFSSVMHEVYSYGGYDRDKVRLALANAHKELVPLGRVVIRDGIKPDEGDALVWLRCRDAELEELFRKFAREFKGKSDAPGFNYDVRTDGGVTLFRVTLHEANEFLSKKDYLTNWAMEVNEEFGVFTRSEWEAEFTALGYRMVECRSYLNPWIKDNRYTGHVWLYADENGKVGDELPYPDTTAVIVAEKV